MLKEAAEVLMEYVVGFLKQVHEKSVGLAKIEAAALYLKSVQILRRHCLVLGGLFFSMVLLDGVDRIVFSFSIFFDRARIFASSFFLRSWF